MSPIDLYFQTANRADFLSDLLALSLVHTVESIGGGSPQLLPVEGIDLDYVGPLVQTPATYDTSVFPPVETTPATFYPGERANLRLTGELSESRAAAIAAASMANTQLLAPADVPPAQIRWAGGGEPWTGQASVPVPQPTTVETVPATKTRLLARLAHRRWQVETGGITLDGVPIRTDRESTALLSAAITFCNLETQAVVRWKAADGQFYELGETALRAIALEVGRHVQRCFALEADLGGQIAAATTAEALTGLAAQVEAFSPTIA